MRQADASARYTERVLDSIDDGGEPERIVLWIERKEGGIWAVGRAINPQHRESDEPRSDDYLFEGYELDDALDTANGALEDDVRVVEQDGDLVAWRRSRARRSSPGSSASSSREPKQTAENRHKMGTSDGTLSPVVCESLPRGGRGFGTGPEPCATAPGKPC